MQYLVYIANIYINAGEKEPARNFKRHTVSYSQALKNKKKKKSFSCNSGEGVKGWHGITRLP